MKKLAVITTHAIQYNAPLFKMLHERKIVDIKVFYTWSQSEKGEKYDPGFGQKVAWDIPLLEGYPYSFVDNISKSPGSSHYSGIDNPTLLKEIKAWGADAVLVYGWSFKSHLKAMRYFHGKIPVFFRGDSTLINNTPGIKSFVRHLFLKWVYRNVDTALYAGTANKKYFLKNDLRENELVFVPHVVDNARFSEGNAQAYEHAGQLRNDLQIPRDATVFLFAGKLEENKNPSLLIKAFNELNDTKAHLIFTGSGPLETALKAESAGNSRIHFIGFQNQTMMPAVYRSADIYVLPSRSETWGLGVNEAMAAGCAIICSDHCGCAEDLVKQYENGIVFKYDDLPALSSALRTLNNAGADLSRWKKASVEIISEWTFEQAAKRIEAAVNNTKIPG